MMRGGACERAWLALFATLLTATGTAAGAQVADDEVFTFLEVERLEYRAAEGEHALHWETQGWAGTDTDKAWLKLEGEKPVDEAVEEAEVQLLYSRLISDFWDLQAGLRYDIRPRPSRGFAVIGLQGLAPLFVEADTAAFLSEDGDLSARLELEYELLLSQRLVLQPSVELNLAAQGAKRFGIGSGLNDLELGLRLRYEIAREFAPYLGVSWERKLGRTADLARRNGEDDDTLAVLVGLRFWF